MILFPKPLSTGITVFIWEPPQPASFSSFELNVLAMASYGLKSSASVLGSQVPPTVEAFLRLATRSGCIAWPLASHPPHPQRKQCVFLPAWWTCAFISASLPHRGRQRHWFAMWKTTRRNKSHHLPKEFLSGIAYLAISSTTKANIVEPLGKRLTAMGCTWNIPTASYFAALGKLWKCWVLGPSWRESVWAAAWVGVLMCPEAVWSPAT